MRLRVNPAQARGRRATVSASASESKKVSRSVARPSSPSVKRSTPRQETGPAGRGSRRGELDQDAVFRRPPAMDLGGQVRDQPEEVREGLLAVGQSVGGRHHRALRAVPARPARCRVAPAPAPARTRRSGGRSPPPPLPLIPSWLVELMRAPPAAAARSRRGHSRRLADPRRAGTLSWRP